MTTELIPLSPEQWNRKLQQTARDIAMRWHNRSPDLWEMYTPEAKVLMGKTWVLSGTGTVGLGAASPHDAALP